MLKGDDFDNAFPADIPDSDWDSDTILALCEFGIADPTDEEGLCDSEDEESFLHHLRMAG
jgi:hypothetical protein